MTGNSLKENAMIVVTGATGKLGQLVVEGLLERAADYTSPRRSAPRI